VAYISQPASVAAVRETLREADDASVILVCAGSISSQARDELLAAQGELWTTEELRYNPFELGAPPHRLLRKGELEEVLSTYRCRKAQLPKIHTNDRIARHFRAQSGEVFEIDRGGGEKYFRVVVAPPP